MAAIQIKQRHLLLLFLLISTCIHATLSLRLLNYVEEILWESQDDSVSLYRTPILLNLPNGDLLAFAEARKYSGGDGGAKFIAVRRSTDNGYEWGPQKFILDDFHAQDGVNTGAALYDYDTNTIFLLYSYCGHLANCVDGPDSQEVGTYMISSNDYGHTWSTPVNMVKLIPGISQLEAIAFGPGYGLQKQHPPFKGRLIACGHTAEYVARTQLCIYSDDHGKTWKINDRFYSLPFNATKNSHDLVPGEVQMVELPNGHLYMTVRNTHSYRCNCRMQLWSYDGGQTFPLEYAVFEKSLIDPNCFASMLHHNNILFFSNPASTSKRVNMTVRWSMDFGRTWNDSLPIYSGTSAYSCLTSINNNHIGLAYEKDGKYISFVNMKLET
ncbi:hypothetical protein BSL78_09542 [Apostichopus japonicus]|uniref:Sialidase-1 n=1 Tax=Stichopus japonicus TaxID=307972 RepID=A0A2G8KZV7_STIJA|nr:hypothetical protein BSL78_09542 [Apostichopus japonicus]